MNDVIIAAAVRTPIGAFNGGLSSVPAHYLGQVAIEEAMRRAAVESGEVDEVIMGQILAAGAGQNPARQAAVNAGIPVERTAYGVNQLCGSGLRTVALGYQAIRVGDSDVVVAGGHESMSQAPHCVHLRNGTKLGSTEFVDTMLRDGLFDAFNGYHMGNTAENVAERWQITRTSRTPSPPRPRARPSARRRRARSPRRSSPSPSRPGRARGSSTPTSTRDTAPRSRLWRGLRPAFAKDGTVTAGNASGINDGAAAVVLMTRENAEKRGVEPLARIVSWATVGVDPSIMGSGPIPASRRALEKAGWSPDDLDLVEANEAFAAQACAVNKDLGWDTDKVNVNGGAIALGHPVGASGARVLTTLLHEMRRRDAKKGLATLCIGGGMGIAMCVERGLTGAERRRRPPWDT